MPGLCGIYRMNMPIDCNFSTQHGITKTIEKDAALSNVYLRQYSIPKFQNDKMFVNADELFYSLEGTLLNAPELYPEYNAGSKSALIRAMYLNEGIHFVNKLRGDFSGVIVDKAKQELYLFTNHIGSKRIFYYRNDETKDFFFASDLKVVTTLMQKYGYPTELSETGAYCLLTFGFMLRNHTLCKDAIHLEPGTILTLSLNTGDIKKETYYTLKNTPYIEDSEENIIQEMERRFCQAIKREYDIDKEYGYRHIVTLSGGLDSRMTLVKGIMLGYGNIRTLTFSQSGYLDQLISQKIAADLNCDYVFHALDNGNFLLDIGSSIKANDGLILYGSAAQQLSSAAMLNWDGFGLLHTGQVGDLILGSYLQDTSHHPVNNTLIHKIAYSSKLLDKVPDVVLEEIRNTYDNDEMCAFYERCINGVYNGYYMTQNYSEYASPFLDVDFLDYVMKIPPKLRYNNKIYARWITLCTPVAARYIWEKTGTKINANYFVSLYKRVIRYSKIHILKCRLISMKPLNHWYSHNPALKAYFDEHFTNGISQLDTYSKLKNDAAGLYHTGSASEKIQVLTLCEAIKWLRLT